MGACGDGSEALQVARREVGQAEACDAVAGARRDWGLHVLLSCFVFLGFGLVLVLVLFGERRRDRREAARSDAGAAEEKVK